MVAPQPESLLFVVCLDNKEYGPYLPCLSLTPWSVMIVKDLATTQSALYSGPYSQAPFILTQGLLLQPEEY